ncbi:hypothetical protein TNCV_2877271 [Trichonephila clavipes]|uniref:Transposase n=1 Tax=Trichonephila clavipes TaxID=2585209 RepID=A0A8X6WDE0_TRICX|nr:hypothetical protein TNCV_2877271 [Trichonephila clavipes]
MTPKTVPLRHACGHVRMLNLLKSVVIRNERHRVLPMTPSRCSGSFQNSPEPKKARMSKSKFKAILAVFLDINGIVMIEWVSSDQNVYKHYYIEVLKRLGQKIRGKKGRSCGERDGCFTRTTHLVP